VGIVDPNYIVVFQWYRRYWIGFRIEHLWWIGGMYDFILIGIWRGSTFSARLKEAVLEIFLSVFIE